MVCFIFNAIIYFESAGNNVGVPQSSSSPRTIFHRSIEACRLTWQDSQLQLIMREDCGYHEDLSDTSMFDPQGLPLWQGMDTKYWKFNLH